MQELVQTVIPVFAIILVGYAIGKIKKIDLQPFIDLIVYIAGPCLIFSSIVSSDINLTEFSTIAVAALAIILTMALLALLILKLTKLDKKGLSLPMTFGNTSYLGYPVALFAFGMDGLSRAVVYDMMNSLIIFISIDGLTRDIILLQAAMPSAVMTMILASKYERDASLVASVVLITTVISMVTIPVILYVLFL